MLISVFEMMLKMCSKLYLFTCCVSFFFWRVYYKTIIFIHTIYKTTKSHS